ncbi:HAMP domain-containing histidine kinase [Alkalihalobacillus sp. MEB130]|uniref:HAMP domain-containing sensor histidine kinase n=1 Tax=Alkalihalobacillus sp. MEB130 TaxID=2976704 RepID=UPI0028E022F0|nr:HAMP domain-containing sensor histidine kinase [Alkalihalobacillus sp. MEB130]MDT8860965.1 HAMP domain-containing histidine kinase [Alkalihalobacillus sp. MEB130]
MSTIIFDLQIFLLNLSFVFLLFFIYHKYMEGKFNKVSNEILIGLISAIAILLCMTFPLSISPGFSFDFRQVPFIIGILYGGRKVGVFLLIVLLTYRFMIGFDAGFYTSLTIYVLIFFIVCYITEKFQSTTDFKQKLTLALTVNAIGILLLLVVSYLFKVNLSTGGWISLTLFYGSQIITMYLFILFIERAKRESYVLSELKELEKLKVVSEMAASISHEVRNPLTVTKGFLQLLQDKTIPEEKKDFYLRLSLNELERAEVIISDYLTFAKPSLENIELLDINKELEYVVKVVTPYATMRNQFITLNQTNPTYIVGDRQKIHQCLINMAKNGIEAMADNGELTITLTQTDRDAVIMIRDTGTGMSDEQAQKLGTPYYSTKTTGTGLGTMVVYSIIKAMRGTIVVDTKQGIGTCFTITLPKAKNDNKKEVSIEV